MATRHYGDWPPVNRRVEMAGPAWSGWLGSRIDEIDAPQFVVSAPTGRYGELIMPPVGEQVLVHWPADRGVGEVHTAVVSTHRGDVPTWRLQADGEPVIVQRRRFVRVSVTMPVVLVRADERRDSLSAIDLSEGGLGAVCGADSDAPVPGEEGIVLLELDDAVLKAQIRVLRVSPTGNAGAHLVAASFVDLAPSDADRVRQFVFSTLRRERASVRA